MCLGVKRGRHMWGGPARGRGTRSSSWVFWHRQEPSSSAWALDWQGVEGRTRQPAASLRGKREGPRLRPDPCDAGSPVSVCPGDPEAKRPKKRRRHWVGQRTGMQRPCPSPNLKAQVTASGRAQEEGRGPFLSAWRRAGSFLPSRNQRETEAQGLLAPEGPPAQWSARLFWVFGRVDNSSKR